MPFLRGFKAKANRIAVGLRSQLGLPSHSPIDIRVLLDRMGIPVVPLASFTNSCPEQVALLRREAGEFSALLLPVQNGPRVVLVNDFHSLVRQNSSLAHEASHALLAHSPEIVPAGMGCRNFDQQQESEANFLAGCVLITNEAARRIVMSGMSLDAAKEHYGVSDQMLQYRLNVSGARVQHQRVRY